MSHSGRSGELSGEPTAPSEGLREEPPGAGPAIAIVGMACRFPGADDLSAFWRQLEAGADLVTEGVPGSGVGRVGELFPEAEVQSEACRFGAYLEGLDRFDAAFFRISPVEAQRLDPQQRLMLETCWQAFEDAGMAPERLGGSRTGVYAGISNTDYRGLLLEADSPLEPAASLYSVTGTSLNTAIGRVAFALGLQGPAMALDTACSSSLVALHQAVSALQRGEADLALAGGVHAILSGRLMEMRANAGMLSPDGRCKTFDASANGYVRGEGCGIVVLKRLGEAEADGDRIWAVVRGSALNQDGASQGLTVPSAAAQQSVIEDALRRARVAPAQVDYVEAHGTGTPVGDPIELRAMAAVYGREREERRPLLIGSVKTNIGHLESAAGVAGLIKVVLAMKQGVIPRHLHFRNPTPQVDWERLPLRVASTPTEWPVDSGRPPLAGVSGFGWSGTNAHVLVEGYAKPGGSFAGPGEEPRAAGRPLTLDVRLPESLADGPAPEQAGQSRGTRFLPLSGKSDPALRELAARYAQWLDGRSEEIAADSAAGPALSDLAWSAGVGRSHFAHRAGVVFHDAATLTEGLRALAESEAGPPPRAAPKLAFAYTGQASQWVGMGETLYRSEPVARAVLDRCDALLRAERGESLLDVMFGRAAPERDLDDPAWKQPAIYALECALTALWASLGIRPEVVVGHSLGELAAAQAAGILSLDDGLRFAAARGALIGALPGDGAMAAVFAPADRVTRAVTEHAAASAPSGLSLAADNGAHQVLSGPAAEVEEILRRFESEGVRVRRLRKSPAYHSPLVEPALDDLEASLAGVACAPPTTELVSSRTGRRLEAGQTLDAAYWRRQVREPVQFRRAVETLAELGVEAVVEIGPHSVLGPMVVLAWPSSPDRGEPPAVLSSLRRPSRDTPAAEVEGAFAAATAGAYELGLPLRFEGLFAGETRRRVELPGYPFQRERYWVDAPKRRRRGSGRPLLGERHESASGEIAFDSQVSPSEPAWLSDHRVFGRKVAPGALYASLAAAAGLAEGGGPVAVEDLLLHTPLVFPETDAQDGPGAEPERKLQVLLDASDDAPTRRVRILSREGSDAAWTLHAQARVSPGPVPPPLEAPRRVDWEALKDGLAEQDVPALYRAKAAAGIDHGPSFRTLEWVRSRPGEALGEVRLPPVPAEDRPDFHPLLLDACFQVSAAAREPARGGDPSTYLPFGCERMWLADRLPERLICHARLQQAPGGATPEDASPEVLTSDARLYDPDGLLIGELRGYSVKRATRSALLAAVEGVDELLYEIAWRERPLAPGMPPAGFLTSPSQAARGSKALAEYLADAGIEEAEEAGLQADLDRLARSLALASLEKLGWEREAGAVVDAGELSRRLGVEEVHANLFRRMLEILARAGLLEESDGAFVTALGAGEPLPAGIPPDPEEFAAGIGQTYPHGSHELGLLLRCAGALAEVLRGREDPLALLFGGEQTTAADLYRKAPARRAASRMLGEVVRSLAADLPEGRRLRLLEVGAGTGSATECVLPGLPAGRFDYAYTDISAGFFADAESRFGAAGAIEYRVLDIEKDPRAQGFEAHAYDLVIAANVLHATRSLDETLENCRRLLAPSGQLVALENLRGRDWVDLIFGQLDGWWRFEDRYRAHHALAGPETWSRAIGDAGFEEVEVLGADRADAKGRPDRGVILARGPAQVAPPRRLWILAADAGGTARELAAELEARNQQVILAAESPAGGESAPGASAGVETRLDPESRESWRALLAQGSDDLPLGGLVHLAALDGHGARATGGEIAVDVRRAAASALALAQAAADGDRSPQNGVWFVTRGAQILERERGGQLAGATLWGLGRVVAREAPQLRPRMLDLDPEAPARAATLAEELLFPDPETQIAYRAGRRRAARLVRAGGGRLRLPEGSDWVLAPDPGGALAKLRTHPRPARPLEPNEVRVAVEAAGLNFRDLLRSLGLLEEGLLGEEMCGRILETGPEVSGLSLGERVVGLGFDTFGPEAVTRRELVAPAPPGLSPAQLATLPTVFTTAALSFELGELKAGERVLIHAGAGGVGLAAIQWAKAAGARVFATASAPKRAYLRSLGVEGVFDSRRTDFGAEVLEATAGAGVDLILNSLTGPGFIEASLSCLARGGRFVELSRRDIRSAEEMAALRPDVAYSVLDVYALKKSDPARAGAALERVVERVAAGELQPLVHSRWPLAETAAALECMREARHVGKLVLAAPPLPEGRLRPDRSYLVTGGLGGIGCAVARWLADRGAGAIVLNGRRPPDPEAEAAIAELREGGATLRVEIADVTDAAELDAMLARTEREGPPLAGVIHSVGVLSDRALGNQSWENFETVLWPKLLGAWHLHRATAGRDLDWFVLFSSAAGILGNPGQANHAAANAFLDQLAAHRRAQGLPGQAIAWGAWSELGEAEQQRERISRRREASGTGWFAPEQGLRALGRLLREDPTGRAVLAMDWPVFAESLETRSPLFEELLAAPPDAAADSAAPEETLLAGLRAAPPAAREPRLVSFLQREVQAVLRLPSQPAPTLGFFELGMDSLMAVELRNRLNRALEGEYTAPNTVAFDYPDIAALARHLLDELAQALGSPAPPARAEPSIRPAPRGEDDGIAIVGMACRFPGAPDLSSFWRVLQDGVDTVTDGRRDSGSWEGVAGDPAAVEAWARRGGFVERIDRFDARFFGITPIGARTMDPQQRLLLETSWRALEDAGIDPERLRGSRTGVYAGIAASEYRDLMLAGGEALSYLGTSGSMAVGGVAFRLGLVGPALPVALNCASSLVAVHQAAESLRRGEVELALVGGVNAFLSPGLTTEMAELGMLSREGRCKAFDASADGFVRGEGCGMVVLKRLGDAEADGDRIWGVVRGTAVNQNGASAGATVPNGPAQERVIRDALARAGVAPAEVDYLEAHGAGSELGDPIELRAAAAAYGEGRTPERPLLIGSVKTNLGHLESAAGMAALIKTVLAMKRGLVPRQLHFRNPSPHLDWDRLPVRVASEATDWPLEPGRPPRAGVSAFGISGTNAHVVVEGFAAPASPPGSVDVGGWAAGPPRAVEVRLPEPLSYRPREESLAPRRARILPLSGKSAPALRQLARRYLDWLDGRAGDLAADGSAAAPALSDLAWTAGVGRSHFAQRAGVVFRDVVSLRERLTALAAAGAGAEPRAAGKLAFAYPGGPGAWPETGRDLFASEPVVRAVLERCDEWLRRERDASLLEALFGEAASDPADGAGSSLWTPSAHYAWQCALTALWSSVGIRPDAVVGHGLGEIAAWQAAGVIGLEDGLRLAAAAGAPMSGRPEAGREGPEADLTGVVPAPPAVPLVSGATGRVAESDAAPDLADWWSRTRRPTNPERCADALEKLGVEALAEIGPGTPPQAETTPGGPGRERDPAPDRAGRGAGVAFSIPPRAAGEGTSPESGFGFVEAVAGAYEAGLAVDFAGLFAGETRRRISLPEYPFQRRRHWIDPPRSAAPAREPS